MHQAVPRRLATEPRLRRPRPVLDLRPRLVLARELPPELPPRHPVLAVPLLRPPLPSQLVVPLVPADLARYWGPWAVVELPEGLVVRLVVRAVSARFLVALREVRREETQPVEQLEVRLAVRAAS